MEVKIIGKAELLEDIAYYARMFPGDHLTLKQIYRKLAQEQQQSALFGYSVSEQWPSKCYSFEPYVVDGDRAIYKYRGVCKS